MFTGRKRHVPCFLMVYEDHDTRNGFFAVIPLALARRGRGRIVDYARATHG